MEEVFRAPWSREGEKGESEREGKSASESQGREYRRGRWLEYHGVYVAQCLVIGRSRLVEQLCLNARWREKVRDGVRV